ncbi:NrdF Ribonucleotide reductase, beta subunit [uncultured Caudovirales phage]|uniref:ribonucleoside-diphosphate reductase n=1 Tax=uncultured Caudovirales phage TaxID=2100421 RepID=A0A6J5MCF7_9CAUD|nr:NrdF Ribonucleotide reductase, beta subunit [uncultured Caudovirales phage]
MSVFNTSIEKSHLERNCFFDEAVDIARYDKVKYQQFEKLTEKQMSFFWRPEEVELSKDSKDFKGLTEHEKHIFTSNLKRQILLDSVQGRAPSLAFLPICSLPELETWIQTWTFFETIHSRSYTHIIRNVYPDPSRVFDEMLEIPEIVDCANSISKYYDELIKWNNLAYDPGEFYNEYEHKKSLWLCLNAVNALEGVRFYVSFACSWNFAELKKMEGNAKIIKFIARDENVHLASTQQLLKILPKEDADFAQINEETRDECIGMFYEVVAQEKSWARYLFKDGSMIGLNEQLLCDYVDHIAAKRMGAIGLNGKPGSNPLPWTQKWIAGSEVQVAPQETEITSYIVGAVKQDVTSDTFKNFSL